MRLRHIEVFNAVMLTGSVGAAARHINVTQPAASRTLQHAELQLGFALFTRHNGRLIPTSEAQSLYGHIESVFDQLEEIRRLAGSLRKAGDTDTVRVLAVMALTHEVLPRALSAFRDKHPEVAIQIEAMHSTQIASALLLREADVGFAFGHVAQPGLLQEPMASTSIVCVAPKCLLDPMVVRRGTVSLPELAALPPIALDSKDPVGASLCQAFREADIHLRPVITVQTHHAALAMAHHGLGVALIDGCTAFSADRRKADVVQLLPHVEIPVQTWRSTQHTASIAVRSFVECMQIAVVRCQHPLPQIECA